MEKLNQINSYKMATPLEIVNKANHLNMEEIFKQQFVFGLIISLLSLAIILFWYKRQKI